MESPRKIAADIIASSREESFEAAVYAACGLVYENWEGISGDRRSDLPQDADSLRTVSPAAVARMRERVDFWLSGTGREDHSAVYEELIVMRQTRLAGGGARQGPAPLVADLMAVLAGSPKTILDPACGIGTTLLAAGRLSAQTKLCGIEADVETAHLAAERLALAGLDADISVGRWLEDAADGKWEAIVVKPPLGLRQAARAGSERSFAKGGEMAWLSAIDDHLVPNGRACVLLPSGSATRRGTVGGIRATLLRSDRVRALIELPPKSILDNGSPACLWVLSGSGSEFQSETLMLANITPLVNGPKPDWDRSAQAVDAVVKWLESGIQTEMPNWLGQYVNAKDLAERGVALPSAVLEHKPREIDVLVTPVAEATSEALLTELRLENFKSVGRPVRIPLKPLTLVFGKNSAGKSSVLQSLLLMKQSIEQDSLNPYGPDARLGSYASLIHGHDSQRKLGWGVTFAARRDETGSAPAPGRLRRIDLTFKWDAEDECAYPESVRGIFVDRQVSWGLNTEEGVFSLPVSELHELAEVEENERALRGTTRSESVYRQLVSTLEHAEMSAIRFDRAGLLPGGVRYEDLEQLASAGEDAPFWASSSASMLKRTGDLVSAVDTELKDLLEKIVYLGPLREAPTRLSQRGGSSQKLDIPFHLLHNVSERRVVSKHLQDLGMRYELDAVPVVTPAGDSFVGELAGLVLTDVRTGVRLSPSDVGFGVSQVLPIIVELSARSNSVIMIEQPEIHLHPGMQAELADLLIESADPSGRGNQVIAETHSESLVLRVQRRIKDGTIDSGDVAIVYVDQTRDGDCVVQELRLNSDGEFLDEWPHGFFEEQFEELFGGL